MSAVETRRVSRRSAETVTALATGALGVAVIVGASEHGIRWGDAGPEAGLFPFAVGILIVLASIGNLVTGLLAADRHAPFLDGLQARRVFSFFAPMALFVFGAVWLGLYVSTALYLTAIMRLQGGYRLVTGFAVGVGTAVFFFVVLEIWFKVALLKGPLEAAFGIH